MAEVGDCRGEETILEQINQSVIIAVVFEVYDAKELVSWEWNQYSVWWI